MDPKEKVAQLRDATGQGIGDSDEELADFFGDVIPNPKFGQPNEPKYIPNPDADATVTDDQGNPVQAQQEPKLKPGDRIVDPKTGQIQEMQEDGSLGPVSTTNTPLSQQNNNEPESDDISGDLPKNDRVDDQSSNQPDLKGQLDDLMGGLQQLNEAIPERLRKDNPLASIAEMVKSYAHAEKKISDQGETIKRQNAILGGTTDISRNVQYPIYGSQQNVPSMQPQTGMTSQGTPSGEGLGNIPDISEEEWEYNPREATQKFLMGTLEKFGPQFAQRIMDTIDARAIHSFRSQHPEWDDLWRSGEIPTVLKNNPGLDNPASCGVVLEKAKQLRQLKLDQQREELLGNQDLSQVNQLTEGMSKITETLEKLNKRIEGVEQGIPNTVQDEVSRKVRSNRAATLQPNATGGGAAQVQQQQRKNQPKPVDPNRLTDPTDVDKLDMQGVDTIVDAMMNVRAPGAAERTPENAFLLDMVHRGKVYDPEKDG